MDEKKRKLRNLIGTFFFLLQGASLDFHSKALRFFLLPRKDDVKQAIKDQNSNVGSRHGTRRWLFIYEWQAAASIRHGERLLSIIFLMGQRKPSQKKKQQ